MDASAAASFIQILYSTLSCTICQNEFASSVLDVINIPRRLAVAVTKWSACSPSTMTILVRIPLKSKKNLRKKFVLQKTYLKAILF